MQFSPFNLVHRYIENRFITERLPRHLADVKTLNFLSQTALNMLRLSENQRIESLRLFAIGASATDVTRQTDCHRRTIINLQRYNVTEAILDRPRAIRPTVTTIGQDRQMTLTHIRRRFKSSKSTAIEYGISSQTVLRR